MIAHIVLFNPKPGLSNGAVESFTQALGDCWRSVPAIRRAVVGPRVAVSPGYDRSLGDKTYQFAAIVEFDDREGLISYLNHPKHHELGRLFWEVCESTIVSEHEMEDGRGEAVRP